MPDFSLLKGVSINRAPFFFHCSPNWSADITFDDCDLWQVHKGKGKVDINGTRYTIGPGSSFVFVPGMHVIGTHDPGDPLVVFAVHFSPVLSRKMSLTRFFQPYQGIHLRERSLFYDWSHQCLSAYHSHPQMGVTQAGHLLMVMLMQLWKEVNIKQVSTKDANVDALLSEIRAHPEKDWTTDNMCRSSALSSTYLNQRFRAKVGKSPQQYVIQMRIERACFLLEESAMSLEQIADSLGYNDVYFFNRQFSKVMGITPGQYNRRDA